MMKDTLTLLLVMCVLAGTFINVSGKTGAKNNGFARSQTGFVVFYGVEFTDADIEKLRTFDTVVLHPVPEEFAEGLGATTTLSRDVVEAIQRDGAKVLGYVSVCEYSPPSHREERDREFKFVTDELGKGDGSGPTFWNRDTNQAEATNKGYPSFLVDQKCVADAEDIVIDGDLSDWKDVCPNEQGCVLHHREQKRLYLMSKQWSGSVAISIDGDDSNEYTLIEDEPGNFILLSELGLETDGSSFVNASGSGSTIEIDLDVLGIEKLQNTGLIAPEGFECKTTDSDGYPFCPTVQVTFGDADAFKFQFTNGSCVEWQSDGLPDATKWNGVFVYPNIDWWKTFLEPEMDLLANDYGMDGFFLDTMDAAGPWRSPLHYPWFQGAIADTLERIKKAHPTKLTIINRALFFWDHAAVGMGDFKFESNGAGKVEEHPFHPHDFVDQIAPHVDGVAFESYMLSSAAFQEEKDTSSFYPKNRCVQMPKVQSESQIRGFKIFGIDYVVERERLIDGNIREMVDLLGVTHYLAEDVTLANISEHVHDWTVRHTRPLWMDSNYPAWKYEWKGHFIECDPFEYMDADAKVIFEGGTYRINFNPATRAVAYEFRFRDNQKSKWKRKKLDIFYEDRANGEESHYKTLSARLPVTPASAKFQVQVKAITPRGQKNGCWSKTGNACFGVCGAKGQACAAGVCVDCVSNLDCRRFSPMKPFCKSERGTFSCVQCLWDTQCTNGFCNTNNGECVECMFDSHCPSNRPSCNVEANSCMQLHVARSHEIAHND